MAVDSVGRAEREQTAWLLEAVDRVLMSMDEVISCANLDRLCIATAARPGCVHCICANRQLASTLMLNPYASTLMLWCLLQYRQLMSLPHDDQLCTQVQAPEGLPMPSGVRAAQKNLADDAVALAERLEGYLGYSARSSLCTDDSGSGSSQELPPMLPLQRPKRAAQQQDQRHQDSASSGNLDEAGPTFEDQLFVDPDGDVQAQVCFLFSLPSVVLFLRRREHMVKQASYSMQARSAGVRNRSNAIMQQPSMSTTWQLLEGDIIFD